MTINPTKASRHHWFSSLWILLLLSMAGCMSTGEGKGHAAIPLTDIEWQWIEAVEKENAQITTVPSPEKYTLVFRTDGTFHGKADCNLIGGSYVNTEGFKITPGPSTKAYCGEKSLDRKYLKLLGLVVAGGLDSGGRLVLESTGSTTRIIFLNGGTP
jgi:heat shock protein HslJ